MKRLLAPLALALALTACTPADIDRFITSTEPTKDVLTNAQLKSLRDCESTDNYEAISRSGTYRGAYQFDLPTWETVGGTGDPVLAPREEQDARARELYARRGSQPWPVCGRHLE